MPSLAIEINYTILTVNFCLGPFLFGPNLSILDLSLAPKLYHMATTLAKYQPQTLPKVEPILGPHGCTRTCRMQHPLPSTAATDATGTRRFSTTCPI